jgi:hypothetical protein
VSEEFLGGNSTVDVKIHAWAGDSTRRCETLFLIYRTVHTYNHS